MVRGWCGLTEEVLEEIAEAELDKRGRLSIDLTALTETKIIVISTK